MNRLHRYAADHYSQFGEDGCIDHILNRIGVEHRVAVEFGAGDGISCSNTARLWRDLGWKALLVEPDAARYEQLEGNAGPFDTHCRRAMVTPTGPFSIASIAADHDLPGVDYMSIDIDGDDIFILEQLTIRPRVISIEFNPTVPPHLAIRPTRPGSTFGASLLSIIRAGWGAGYRFVGATYCNAFLVDDDLAAPFADYDTDPESLLAGRRYTYLVSDFTGRVAAAGESLPWGARAPYVEPLDGAVVPATDSPQHIRRGFEALWGPALWLPPSWANVGDPNSRARHLLADVLGDRRDRPRLVCIDTSNEPDPGALQWIDVLADTCGYRVVRCGPVLGLVLDA